MNRSARKKQQPLPPESLDEILDAEIEALVSKGWKLEAAITVFGRGAMLREPLWRAFLRDLVLSVVTLGVWLLYVVYRAMIGKKTSTIITVDKFGRVKSFNRTSTRAPG